MSDTPSADPFTADLSDATPLDTARAVFRLAIGVVNTRLPEAVGERARERARDGTGSVTPAEITAIVDREVQLVTRLFPPDDPFRREIERYITAVRGSVEANMEAVVRRAFDAVAQNRR